MTYEEKYEKLVEKVNDAFDRYYNDVPDSSDVMKWMNDEVLSKETLKARNLGMFMGIEAIKDFIDEVLEAGE